MRVRPKIVVGASGCGTSGCGTKRTCGADLTMSVDEG
jgi:hypothetical protein